MGTIGPAVSRRKQRVAWLALSVAARPWSCDWGGGRWGRSERGGVARIWAVGEVTWSEPQFLAVKLEIAGGAVVAQLGRPGKPIEVKRRTGNPGGRHLPAKKRPLSPSLRPPAARGKPDGDQGPRRSRMCKSGTGDRRWWVPVLAAGLVPLAIGCAVNMAKFGVPFGLPITEGLVYRVWGGPNGGHEFSPRFLPSTLDAYLRPDGIRLTPVFPFVTLPAQVAEGVGGVSVYANRTASLTGACPSCSSWLSGVRSSHSDHDRSSSCEQCAFCSPPPPRGLGQS